MKSSDTSNLTPAMKQYVEVKDKYPDSVVLFRMGDFYETFYQDAKTVARVLDIVLTARGKGEKRAPLAGIPYHALDNYLGKLVKAGYKVVIVEQLEDPKKAKGLVKRGVTRIVTPGTVIEDSILEKSNNNYIMSIDYNDKEYGIAVCDVSTGEFFTTNLDSFQKLSAEIEKFSPAEIIIPLSLENATFISVIKEKDKVVNVYDDRFFFLDKAKKTILENFNMNSLDAFGLKENISVNSSGALLSYIKEMQMHSLSQINSIKPYSIDKIMCIDSATQRNLELIKNIKDQSTRGSLYEVINHTVTAMGNRKLKNWILHPSLEIEVINNRLDAVDDLRKDSIILEELREILSDMQDMQRIISRVSFGNANPKDLIALKGSLAIIPKIKSNLDTFDSKLLSEIKEIDDLKHVVELIGKAIKENPSITVREGNIIKKGYNKALDDLHRIAFSTKDWLHDFENKERERTGIKSLKVKYNKVFGYFIEVTKSNLNLVPADYIRKQTQANSERYITEEMKKKESVIIGAEERIHNLEYELFQEIIKEVSNFTKKIQLVAEKVSELDCLLSFAECSEKRNYAKPVITDSYSIFIEEGRHPVVENVEQGQFIANDMRLDNKSNVHIITGPNMAGKSTFLRQNALIVLLAQIGSFVPATYAEIGIVDRIFSRVGAYDDLSMGQSTFMVEMTETANILNNATKKSMIILDEIGRGTSTYDGFSIAWAITEYIASQIKAKTLFATHYHQLNKMCEEYPHVKNYHVSVLEDKEDIVFLRKIEEGGTDKSYGVQVARLAGLPKKVIERAQFMMGIFEHDKFVENLHNKVISDYSQKTNGIKSKDKDEDPDEIEVKREIRRELITETIKKKKGKKEEKQVSLFEVIE